MSIWEQVPCTADGANPDDWHCYDKKRTEAAKEACRACPLVDACLQEAIDTREKHGVWGATTEQERRELFKTLGRRKGSSPSHPKTSPTSSHCRSAA